MSDNLKMGALIVAKSYSREWRVAEPARGLDNGIEHRLFVMPGGRDEVHDLAGCLGKGAHGCQRVERFGVGFGQGAARGGFINAHSIPAAARGG